MNIEILNQTKDKIPKKFVQDWTKLVYKNLKSQKILSRKFPKGKKDLIVVFVTSAKMKKLNSQFRGKNKHTDILSFEPIEESSLNHEIGYMLIHGILHLLGFDHETSENDAKKMFKIQDTLFDKLI